jgi:cysteine-rich repeat protein
MRVTSFAVVLAIGCGPETSVVESASGSTSDDTSTSTTSTSTTTSSSTEPLDTSTSTESSTGAPTLEPCGNGELDPDEGCDDGNRDDDDGCDSDCVPTEAIVWTADHGGAAGQNDCAARVVANDAGTWVAGYLRDGDMGDVQSDAWLGRIADDGAWLWHWTMGGEGNDNDRTLALSIDANEDAYVGGWTTWNGQHAWVGRVDPDGAAIWTDLWSDGLPGGEYGRGIALVDGAPWLVLDRDEAPALVQRWSADGVHGMDTELVAPEGMELRVVDVDHTAEGVWLVLELGQPFTSVQPMLARLGPDGAIAESIIVNTPSRPSFDDDGISGAVRGDGSAVLVSYDEPAGGETPTVRVFDVDGVAIDAWLVELDGDPRVNDVEYGDDGTIVLVGERFDVPWTRSVTSDGTLVWDRLHTPPGGRGQLEAVAIAPDGDVVVAGCVGVGSASDVWVRRYRP